MKVNDSIEKKDRLSRNIVGVKAGLVLCSIFAQQIGVFFYMWQRGSNEHTNGLLREYFPKGKDITEIPDDYIQRKVAMMNLRPRKCLNYRIPYEVHFEKVLHLV